MNYSSSLLSCKTTILFFLFDWLRDFPETLTFCLPLGRFAVFRSSLSLMSLSFSLSDVFSFLSEVFSVSFVTSSGEFSVLSSKTMTSFVSSFRSSFVGLCEDAAELLPDD